MAGREGVYYRDLTEDLGYGAVASTPLFLDSKATIDLTKDPVAFKRTKHILRHAYWLRDVVQRGIFAPRFVDTARQIADIMTKALRPAVHREMVKMLFGGTGVTTAKTAGPTGNPTHNEGDADT